MLDANASKQSTLWSTYLQIAQKLAKIFIKFLWKLLQHLWPCEYSLELGDEIVFLIMGEMTNTQVRFVATQDKSSDDIRIN